MPDLTNKFISPKFPVSQKTLIYSCVFFNEYYINLIYLLLKSYKLFGNAPDNVDYLIICNPDYKKNIQTIFEHLDIKGKIWCLDLKTKFDACCSRLKIFHYPNINLYNKILYLDCDVLITNSLNNILDFILENKLYALEEGYTSDIHDYWGRQFFADNNPNCPAFNSGVLLFNNNTIIKDLFDQIISHINQELKKYNYERLFEQKKELNFNIIFGDQPFIVYNAFKNNLYDNQKLINIVIINPTKFNNQTISHFAGGPGEYVNKIQKMIYFMDNIMLGNKQKIIPKIILQTSKNEPEQYIIDIINKKCPKWKYIHFTDSQIIEYFKENPIKEFSNIINVFNSFTKGQHKADLFRYYFLYLNGGIFLDSDAIFEVNIDNIIKTYDSVFVKSFMKNTHLFNGFIATYPNNPIIYDALKHAYEADDTILQKSFHYLCEELWRIFNRHNLPNMKIYQEYHKPNNYGVTITLDDNGEKILSHHWRTKRVPFNIEGSSIKQNDCDIIKGNIIKVEIPKTILQLSKNEPEQYVVDMINYYSPQYKYIHFTDSQIIEYLKKNPIKEFSNIINVFNSFTKGQHKADLFRYFYLYLNGGAYLDYDAMIYTNIDNIILHYDCVFVKTFPTNQFGSDLITNAYLFVKPKDPVIYQALINVYNINPDILKRDYAWICRDLFEIYNKIKPTKCRLLHEVDYFPSEKCCKIFDENKTLLMIHYPITKKIPKLNHKIHEGFGGSVILDDNKEKKNKIIPFNDNIFTDKTIHVGSSKHNNKEIILPSTLEKNNLKINNIPLNKQEIGWNDTFSTKIIDNKLVVTRIDLNSGWGQDLILEYDDHGELAENVQTALIVEPRKLDKLDKIINKIYYRLNKNSIYKWNIIFYCGKGLKTYFLPLFKNIEITIIELEKNNFTTLEYNDFLKSLSLWKNIKTLYTLVFQSDCYIFNNPPYTIDYFINENYSFIGGNMSYKWNELKYYNLDSQYRNFNGGLALRNTKDMIKIIELFPPKKTINTYKGNFEEYAEDVYTTIGAYKLNLKVGNTKDAEYFSCHSIINNKCFGIHNSNTFLDKKQLLETYPEIYNQPYIISDNFKKEFICQNNYINNDGWKVIENDNIVFMETNVIDKQFLNKKNTPFVLVTANNLDYPSGYNNDFEILNNPYLIKWFGTFPAISHPKFSPLPLGPKAYWKKTNFLSEYINTNIYDIASKDINPLVQNRKSLLYCNFSNTTGNPYIKEHTNCRIKLWEILKNIKIPVSNVKSQKDYLIDLSNYVYCLCPPGNGCDSHRLWEALMMNCIPVVIKYEPLSELYKNLPVLVLDKWEDLTVELLNSKKEYFSNFVFNRELIYKKYYIDKINKEVEPICKLQSLQNKLKIIDCFTFYNELEMLTYRLNILNDVVDYFVLVESTHSFVGKEKPLFYQDNKHLFKEFNHKIIHIVIDDFPYKYPNINFETGQQWNNEKLQRNCISRGLNKLSLQNNDVITITDLDEIPNPKILQQIKNNDIVVDINILELDLYYYNLHTKWSEKWLLSKIISYKNYKEKGLSCEQIRQNKSFTIIKNAGWHLSYFGNEQFIKNKIENFCHQEYNKVEFTDEKLIKERMTKGADLFNRKNSAILNISIEDNDNLPPKYYIYLKKFYKTNKILLYNGFPYHFEMFGCVLDYAKKYNLDVDIVNTREDTNKWFSFYQKYFTFNLYKDLSVIDINCYKLVILLTDDDYSFPKELVSENIICINHFHKSRRNDIKYQLPITKFREDIVNYCFPVWNCITHEEKLNALKKNNKPIVTLIGISSIKNPNNIKNIIKNYQDFEFILINRDIPNNIPDFIKTYKNLSTVELFNLLKQTSYVLYLSSNTNNSVHQQNNESISACFPLAISNGCHLIIPTGMIKPLNLNSIIYYDIHNPIKLNKETNLDIVFYDRYLLNIVKDNSLQNSMSYNKTEWNEYNKQEINEFNPRVLIGYDCPNELIRVGPRSDGGYVMVDGFEYDHFLSCGIAGDIRFELVLLDKYPHLKCDAFDGTINRFPIHNKDINWIKKNVGYINSEKITNLKPYIQNYKNIFLKMDIEGSEFNWIDSMSLEDLNCFSQIIMEIHWPFDKYRYQMLVKLNQTHYIIHIHGNNFCDRDIPKGMPSGRTYDGTQTINYYNYPSVNIPEVFEITYIRKSNFTHNLNKIEKKYPTLLDVPNNPRAKDIEFTILDN